MVSHLISCLHPFDAIEEQHIHETLLWLQSGAPIYRIQRPDIPPKHLVVYCVLLDEEKKKILLVDHKKAQLWLPAGGHVEPDEDPSETVKRECLEELGIEVEFWKESPLFLTSTVTGGLTPGHIDVTLWYVLKAKEEYLFSFDKREFEVIEWFNFEGIPYERSDPHMKRFMSKLKGVL
jgi:8-oxo-dGTP diphosphatase